MKTCFKCQQLKPLDAFYKHSAMADGHVNKCIECNKKDVLEYRSKQLKKPEWVAADRAKHRDRMVRLRAKGKYKIIDHKHQRAWEKRNPHKRATESKAAQALKKGLIIKATKCNRCPSIKRLEMHHADYDKPLDVEWLCSKCHGKTRRK